MRGTLSAAAAAALMGLTATPASAQDQCITSTQRATARQTIRTGTAATAFDTGSGPGFLIPGVQINAGVEGGKSAQLSLSTVTDLRDCMRAGQLEFGVTFSAPFDQDEGRGDLVTSRALPGGFAAEASVTASIGPRFDPTREDGFIPTRYLILHGTIGINVDDFKYRDPTTFLEAEERRTGVSFSGSIGHMPNGRTFLAGGFRYERSYEAPAKRILCQSTNPPPIECIQAVFGPPERDVDATVFALMRRLNPFGDSIPMAMELRAAYDIQDDIFAVDLPLYLFLDSDRGYRGGIRAGWTSEHNDFTFGVFIGVPFSIFGL